MRRDHPPHPTPQLVAADLAAKSVASARDAVAGEQPPPGSAAPCCVPGPGWLFRPCHRRFHVVELGLFGSVARGEARPESDLDVWVQVDPLTPYALVHLQHQLEALLPCPVELVRFRDRMNPALRKRIEQEGLRACQPCP